MDSGAEVNPLLTADERGELGSIAYLQARLDAMLERGLISPEAHATVAAESAARREEIGRLARYRTAIATATTLARSSPGDALDWANRAREVDPGREEAWGLAIDLLRRLRRHDEALALCTQAAERFPSLQARLEELRRAGDEPEAETLAEAREALARGEDVRVVSLCSPVLELRPEHFDALVLMAFATQRMGRLDEAQELYARLTRLQPDNPVWAQWVRSIEARRPSRPRFVAAAMRPAKAPEAAASEAPRLSWASVAGEFLEEHWQKLILSLAVLLIVVSSTVGAHMLLGPKLWSPVGKCALALVYTVMFAGFGAGLLRWGAERAGRMMLVTTLIVVPVNFMLAGEMRLLFEPSVSRLAVLALDVAALFLVTKHVAAALGWRKGATFLAVALVALSACDAATAKGVSFAWGFSAFLIPPWVFLAATWWLNTRVWGEDDEQHREFVYFTLGLLGFAFLSGLLRTAVVLEPALRPSLFAVPVMLTAIACVLTAHHLARYEKDPRRVSMMRFGGFVLSALAFALALARPPGPSSLHSGNTLATALLGLALYAASLRAYRQPAYLYFAFGALFLGYFGAFHFTVDLIRSVEGAAGRLMGYRGRLPFPFKSINGPAFNVVLGLLALHFSRRWKDERLARHCHYLGVPFSIAACLLSTLETKAAVLCLSGYAVLYAAAVPIFRQPLLIYLACSALAGSLVFGSMLVPGVSLAARALGAALLGLAYRAISAATSVPRMDPAYRRPLAHSAVTLAVAAMAGAGLSAMVAAPVGLAATAAFGLAALLCGLVLADLPRPAVAHLMVVGALGACLCAFDLATGHNIHAAGPFGVVAALLALVVLEACEWASTRRTVHSAILTAALPDAVQALVILAVALTATGFRDHLLPAAATLAIGAAALLRVTRFRRDLPLVYLGLGLAVASELVLCSWLVGPREWGVELATLALAASVASLALWRAGTVLRRRGGSDFFAVPCFTTAIAVTALVFALAFSARAESRAAFPASAAALLVNSLVYLLLTSAWRSPGLTYASVGALVSATYLTLFSIGDADPEKAYVLGLVAVVEGLALWTVGRLCHLSSDPDHARVYGRPLEVSALLLTVLAMPPGYNSSVTMALVTVSLLLMIRSFPSAGWLYAAMGSLACLLYVRWFQHVATLHWMVAAVAGSFGLWGLGIAARRVGPPICRRASIPDLAFEFPFFHAAILSGMLAVLFRLGLSLGGDVALTAHAWAPLSLALFCVLMIGVYPGRVWVDAFVVLCSIGLATAAAPLIGTPAGWLLAAMILSLAWLGLGHDPFRFEPVLCRRLGVEEFGAGAVLQAWSIPLFAIAALPTALLVLVATVDMAFLDPGASKYLADAGWPSVGATLVLAWIYIFVQGYRIGEDGQVALGAVQTLLVWWFAASPWLGSRGIPPRVYLPLATAGLALAMVLNGDRREGGVVVSRRQVALAEWFAFLLALFAVAFTRGEPNLTTMGALILVTATLAVLAIMRHRIASAYAGGLAWCALCVLAVYRLIRPRYLPAATPTSLDVALGTTAAIYGLWALTVWLKGTSRALEAWGSAARGGVVRALERIGLLGSLSAAFSVALLAAGPGRHGDVEAMAGVGVLLAVAAFHVLLARRWRAEWLVYTAQAALLGSYFHYRHAYSASPATDAGVLTLLGYVDLGLAEVMQRLRMNLYARPTLYVSLVLPLIPLAMAVSDGRLDDLSLFLMLGTAAFYGVACYTRQWKSLGYAAAVLLNAMLWLAWSRAGWKLAHEPQFFLIPVGLSAILFAEVNREELGREAVNAIRGIGLAVIYLSLALPIWQFESLAAWLTLLLLSLAGIFLGIGLRAQSFLWLGLIGFVLDVVYQLGRMGTENALARWAIMLALGILLILFVALNEKKRIVATMREYYEQARQWE